MGPAVPLGRGEARISGVAFPGLGVSMGNPHLACLTDVEVDTLDLSVLPGVDPAMFPDGVNVELVNVLAAEDAPAGASAHVRLRVYERGVGETRSCGTGACAAAYAALEAGGRTAGTVVVDVPGGRLSVEFDGTTTVLSGPAVVVATGVLTEEWLRGR
jgi:diaminopimelate epimerase